MENREDQNDKSVKAISFDELMEEVSKYKRPTPSYKIVLHPEQERFLIACRKNKKTAIMYADILTLWSKRWKKISETTLKQFLKSLREQGKI